MGATSPDTMPTVLLSLLSEKQIRRIYSWYWLFSLPDGPEFLKKPVGNFQHENYPYSLVYGPDKSCLWILARNPELDNGIKEKRIAKAAAPGFDTSKTIDVRHKDRVRQRDCTKRREARETFLETFDDEDHIP